MTQDSAAPTNSGSDDQIRELTARQATVAPPVDHTEHEDMPWERNIPPHEKRSDSPDYVRARKKMVDQAKSVAGFFYGDAPYEDHHGGGLWLKDADGWFMVRNLAGIEWSAQFCADPAKVDQLRINARRLYAGFPGVAEELGIRELLDTPITDAAGVARWTDSICNASVALPKQVHTGVLPKFGGIHHYPAPVAEIAMFKFADFELWVKDATGSPAAVVPVDKRGSGDGRVRVLYATPGTPLAEKLSQSAPAVGDSIAGEIESEVSADPINEGLVLEAHDPLAQAAFRKQTPAVAQTG
jgi:hypothetical protein